MPVECSQQALAHLALCALGGFFTCATPALTFCGLRRKAAHFNITSYIKQVLPESQ